MRLDSYEQKLLSGWEEVYKKGQLTLWIFLALRQGPKHMGEIKTFIKKSTHGTLSADNQSMYRALRRYHDAELVEFTNVPGDNGPERKVYRLSVTGKRVLQSFLKRNIIDVIYQPPIKKLIGKDE